MNVPGYAIVTVLRESRRSQILRAVREADGAPVVLKALRREHPSLRDVARLRHEHAILRRFSDEGVIGTGGMIELGSRALLVLEDFNGAALSERIPRGGMALADFMAIAPRLVRAVATVHAAGVLHKDIKPDNIIVGSEPSRVALADFSIASVLAEEPGEASASAVLEGSLAYLAPEQTGRMNRPVDYRSDYYALGATFYEMLTGAPPFDSADPLELVHAHVARVPPTPRERRADVPEGLSALVMRLLAKTAEARYQSAAGLLADLERVAAFLDGTGPEVFTPGERDIGERFMLSAALVGREADAAALLAAFERATAGHNELVLLAGPAGIGKSALVREIHRPLVRHRGYFCSGKFDQLARSSPYSALTQALRGYLLQILGEPEQRLLGWRRELAGALAPNARVLFDTLPELAGLLGEQPAVPELAPAESANRFHAAMRALLRALAGERHSAAIFLDDLQWSDLATLKLIEELAGDPELPHVLWIGVYRDDEVGPDHPLARTIAAVVARGAAVTRRTLPPLGRADVAVIVADSLRCGEAEAEGLAAIVHDRSEGNPLFVRTILQSLHDQGALVLDPERGAWAWTAEGIERAALPERVVDLVARRIAHLPGDTQALLRQAACCGNRFDVHLLARIAGRSSAEVVSGLWPAAQRGLLRPVGDDYKFVDDDARAAFLEFVHDRIQQVAYSQVVEDERARLHLAAGRTLLALRGEEGDDALFAVAGHLSRAAALISEPEERLKIAGLDLRAARRAKAATAYGSAREYLTAGAALLADDAWDAAYGLAFALHREAVECAYLAGDPEAAVAVFGPLLARARTARERAELHALRATLETNRGELRTALASGRAGLRCFGVELPEAVTPADVVQAFEEYQALRAGAPGEALLRWPEATDEDRRVEMRTMVAMTAAAYFTDTNLASLLLLRTACQSLRHGLTEVSAYGLIGVGLVLSGGFGRYAEADEHGRLARDLNERFANVELRARIGLFWATFMLCWTRPWPEVLAALREAHESGMQAGDIIYAVYSAVTEAFHMVLAGDPLPALAGRVTAVLPLVRRRGLADQTATLMYMQRVFGALADPERPGDAADVRATMSPERTPLAMFYADLYDAIVAYVRGDEAAAEAAIASAGPRAFVAFGSPIVADLRFYECLILARAHGRADAGERTRIEGVMARNLAELTTWAASAPSNYAAREVLVRGEWAAATGDDAEALRRYNGAIALAREHRAPHIEAIACECALRFAAARGFPILLRAYLAEAITGYRAWGAAAKVAALAREFGEHVAELTTVERAPSTTATMTRATSAVELDLETVLKAGRAISGELQMDRLLRRLIGLLVENAGARRGVLVVAHDGRLWVEAEARVDDAGEGGRLGVRLEDYPDIPHALVHQVARLREDVVLADARVDPIHGGDPYVVARGSRSMLCTPVLHQGEVACVVFLEHDLAAGAFTRRRLAIIKQLAVQMAISLTNARLYRSLDEARIAALAADRAKTRFLMNMSHELRTPLNAILGYAELVVESVARGELGELERDLRAIHRAGMRLLRSVSSILELTRLETDARTAQLVATDVESLIGDLGSLFAGMAAERGNTLTLDLRGTLPPVVTDVHMLRYNLMTLLDNACRFTKDGAVTLSVACDERGDAPWVVFTVRDSGIGIEAAVLPTIFGAFTQGDESSTRRFEGTGVSLAVAQRFCELLGGELRAESSPDAGTTMTLRIPVDARRR
ncbi:MAG: AAA family ATPase [Myxococcales bacterium]|nr:AAA family ATPase [Myxococcales bacterium]